MKSEDKSRTALITGSTAGIGRAIAKLLAAGDINIVVSGRRHESEQF